MVVLVAMHTEEREPDSKGVSSRGISAAAKIDAAW